MQRLQVRIIISLLPFAIRLLSMQNLKYVIEFSTNIHINCHGNNKCSDGDGHRVQDNMYLCIYLHLSLYIYTYICLHILHLSHFNVPGIAYDNARKYIQVLIKSHCPMENLSLQQVQTEDGAMPWRGDDNVCVFRCSSSGNFQFLRQYTK